MTGSVLLFVLSCKLYHGRTQQFISFRIEGNKNNEGKLYRKYQTKLIGLVEDRLDFVFMVIADAAESV